MATTCTEDGYKQTTKTSTTIKTKRTKKHRTTEEEMEGPTSSWGSRNRITCLTLQELDDDDDGMRLLRYPRTCYGYVNAVECYYIALFGLTGVMRSFSVACCHVIPYPVTKIINEGTVRFSRSHSEFVFNQITSYCTFCTHSFVVGCLYDCIIGAGTCSRLLRQLEVSSRKNCILLFI